MIGKGGGGGFSPGGIYSGGDLILPCKNRGDLFRGGGDLFRGGFDPTLNAFTMLLMYFTSIFKQKLDRVMLHLKLLFYFHRKAKMSNKHMVYF